MTLPRPWNRAELYEHLVSDITRLAAEVEGHLEEAVTAARAKERLRLDLMDAEHANDLRHAEIMLSPEVDGKSEGIRAAQVIKIAASDPRTGEIDEDIHATRLSLAEADARVYALDQRVKLKRDLLRGYSAALGALGEDA